MILAGIEIFAEEGGPWYIRDMEVYPYRVSDREPVERDRQLALLVGCEIDGRKIVGVESFAVSWQHGRPIGIAFKVEE